MGLPGHEHLGLVLHSYPCARLRIWSRETIPAVPSWYCTGLISTRNYSLGTQVNAGSILYTLSIHVGQAPHELPFERKAKPLFPVPSTKAK